MPRVGAEPDPRRLPSPVGALGWEQGGPRSPVFSQSFRVAIGSESHERPGDSGLCQAWGWYLSIQTALGQVGLGLCAHVWHLAECKRRSCAHHGHRCTHL
jgi:hypothetical protein